MRNTHIGLTTALLAAAGFAVAAPGDRAMDLGKPEYDANCASCHGAGGKGDGYLAPWFGKAIPDLTGIAAANGGTFPFDRITAVIDGREEKGAHGSRAMPVWGKEYRVKAGEYYVDVAYDPEAFARTRITGIAEYLDRLQER